MCIMEVRPGQRTATIAQACAHNVNTVVGDLEMFAPLLRKRIRHLAEHNDHGGSRREVGALTAVLHAHDTLREAYATLLSVFEEEVSGEVRDTGDHHGSERTLTEQAHHDAVLARRFMTR